MSAILLFSTVTFDFGAWLVISNTFSVFPDKYTESSINDGIVSVNVSFTLSTILYLPTLSNS